MSFSVKARGSPLRPLIHRAILAGVEVAREDPLAGHSLAQVTQAWRDVVAGVVNDASYKVVVHPNALGEKKMAVRTIKVLGVGKGQARSFQAGRRRTRVVTGG